VFEDQAIAASLVQEGLLDPTHGALEHMIQEVLQSIAHHFFAGPWFCLFARYAFFSS
jgi:hypothetical protein